MLLNICKKVNNTHDQNGDETLYQNNNNELMVMKNLSLRGFEKCSFEK